jgi:uncharacterized protein YecE (DUF72 family)
VAAAYIGTSGWMYKHWRGPFYPPGLNMRVWLERYSETFDCVEVNASFYRLPSRETFVSWAQRTPPDFRFAVKGSRFITHLKRLTDPGEHVPLFFERASGLGDKLGPVLWQLPPNFSRNDERLSAFLETLPSSVCHAMEFRHPTWLHPDVYNLLRQHKVALVIPDHPKLPKELVLTTNWTFVRFHHAPTQDGNYPGEIIEQWASWCRQQLAEGVDVWAFFNNDWHAFALANAQMLREAIDGA